MASELEVNISRIVRDKMVASMDKVTTSIVDIMADMPRTTDGQIRDPYWRGIMDGVTMFADGMRAGAEQGVQEISER